jgi:hypothetical protein
MSKMRPWLVFVALAALLFGPGALAGCGGGGHEYALDLGGDDAGMFASVTDASPSAALDAYIQQGGMTVSFVTLSCSEGCATVEAVATGGNAPYSYTWEDGSANPTRQVCPTATTNYSVTVTDTGTSGEFARTAETARASLTAKVIACPDGGAMDGGVAPTVYWATWSQVTPGASGTATGSLSPPQGDVQVSYAGEVDSNSAATGGTTLSGWGPVTFTPTSTFESATVGNAPPPTGMIALAGTGSGKQTITFSRPVKDPLVAVLSGATLEFDFDAPAMVLSTGQYLLGGISMGGSLSASGQSMTVAGGAGVVELPGTFSSLTFTMPTPESVCCFTVFTIGIRGLP